MSQEWVNHPSHYGSHPSGVECIEIVEHMDFNLGSAIKYIFRREDKGKYLEDLKKSKWYVDREKQLLLRDNGSGGHYIHTSRATHHLVQDAAKKWLDAEPDSNIRSAFREIMAAHTLMRSDRVTTIVYLENASEHLDTEITVQEFQAMLED